MRLDADVLDHFKSQGGDWQSRMNAALRDVVDRELEATVGKPKPWERG
jgi:uncharacterized protein (DUF4415 family)